MRRNRRTRSICSRQLPPKTTKSPLLLTNAATGSMSYAIYSFLLILVQWIKLLANRMQRPPVDRLYALIPHFLQLFLLLFEFPMNASSTPHIDKMSNIYNNSVVRFYHYVFHDLSDPRTMDWFLITSPVPGASILIGYLYFVLSWGPRHMEHRKPYQLKNILVVYNFLQVLISIWLFYEGLDSAWLRKYSWKCQPVDFSNSPEALRVARGVYFYFLAKISELLDTVFFVLRKKESQITFLHLYHHTVMPMVSWGATKYYPGGHGTFIGVINSFVHIIMYTYYLLAALLPQYQKYLWWKRYITTLQMGQFCLAFLHNCQLLFYDCDYPRWSVILVLPNAMFFYFLFADFYNHAYKPEKKPAKSIEGKEKNGIAANGKGKTD